MKDTIENSIFLPAAPQKVWNALTTPEEISGWFAKKGVEGKIEQGSEFTLCFQMSESIGKCLAKVVTFEPITRFAYRWMPGDCNTAPLDTVPTTLVEFTLSPEGEGTRLNLRESGFASLPETMRDQALKDNTAGWTEELGHLVEYVENWKPLTKTS